MLTSQSAYSILAVSCSGDKQHLSYQTAFVSFSITMNFCRISEVRNIDDDLTILCQIFIFLMLLASQHLAFSKDLRTVCLTVGISRLVAVVTRRHINWCIVWWFEMWEETCSCIWAKP